jgi:hypothetical protein
MLTTCGQAHPPGRGGAARRRPSDRSRRAGTERRRRLTGRGGEPGHGPGRRPRAPVSGPQPRRAPARRPAGHPPPDLAGVLACRPTGGGDCARGHGRERGHARWRRHGVSGRRVTVSAFGPVSCRHETQSGPTIGSPRTGSEAEDERRSRRSSMYHTPGHGLPAEAGTRCAGRRAVSCRESMPAPPP